MITIKDKLDIFRKLIYEEEEEKYKKALKDLDEKARHLIENKKLEIEKKKEEMAKKEALLKETQKNRIISERRQELNSKLLLKRKEILEDLIASLKEKAINFTLTDEYKNAVIKSISEVLLKIDDRDLIITITEEDRKKLESSIFNLAKINNKNISISTVPKSNIIGGFIISDKEKTYNIDNSYKTIIEENRYEIGKRLYKALEEAGDLQWKI
ncbi:MAG: V-type ATP synthase subunit E [Tissierellales bacterium]